MASGEADVILVPKVDYEQMKQTARRMQEALSKASEQAAKDVQNDLRDGISDGIEKGADDGFTTFKGKATAAIASFALAAGSVITDSLQKTIGDADTYVEMIRDKAKSIRDQASGADALGIKPENFIALSAATMGVGGNADDLQGLLEGLSSNLDAPEMKSYQEVAKNQGLDQAFFNALYTASDMNKSEAHTWFSNKLGLGETDATLANKLTELIRDMKANGEHITKDSFFDKAVGSDVSTEKIKKDLERSLPNLKKMEQGDAQRYLKSIGVTKEQAEAYNSREESKRRVNEKQLENITLKVQTANFLDKVTISQLDATAKSLNVLASYGKNVVEEGKDVGVALSDFVKDPTTKKAKVLTKEVGDLAGDVSPIASFNPNPVSQIMEYLSLNKKIVELLQGVVQNGGTQSENSHVQSKESAMLSVDK